MAIQIYGTRQSASMQQVIDAIKKQVARLHTEREFHRNPNDWDNYQDWLKEMEERWHFLPSKGDGTIHLGIFSRDFFDLLLRQPNNPLRTGDSEENAKALVRYVDKIVGPLGWFVSSANPGNKLNPTAIHIEPLTQKPIDLRTQLFDPPELYHFTPFWNKERILRKGLIPSKGDWSVDFKYPPRVHAMLKCNLLEIEDLYMSLHSHGHSAEDIYNGNVDRPPMVVFAINTNKLRPGTKFYRDTSAPPYGVWTYTHVPPQALSIKHEDPITDEWKEES